MSAHHKQREILLCKALWVKFQVTERNGTEPHHKGEAQNKRKHHLGESKEGRARLAFLPESV